MRPLVIVPFHDPKWTDNTAANLQRQVGLRADVVYVLNGAAYGTHKPGAVNLSVNASSHAAAVNAGAEWGQALGYTHAVCFDSDDYYGAGYLKQAFAALEQADYIGKRSVFAMLGDGLHLFHRTEGRFLGGTIGFQLDVFQPMPAVLQDDTEWCRLMENAGLHGVDTGVNEFCYIRHGGNAHWRANDVTVRRAWGGSHYFGKVPIDTVERHERAPGMRLAPPTDDEVFASM